MMVDYCRTAQGQHMESGVCADVRIDQRATGNSSDGNTSLSSNDNPTSLRTNMNVSRLCGNNVTVFTGGGSVSAKACYCGSLDMDCGIGDVSISHLNCGSDDGTGGARIQASGSIGINGLDGAADIQGGSGSVNMQVRCWMGWDTHQHRDM
jgi:hypothetical protein